jgi:UPF0755 protein
VNPETASRVLAWSAIAFTVAVVLVASIFFAGTPGAILGSGSVTQQLPSNERQEVSFLIEEGTTAGQIGEELESIGVIRSARQFQALVRLMGVGNQLNSGSFILETNMSTPAVIQRLLVPDAVPVIRVTFPEGIRIEEMAEIAAEAGFGTRTEFLEAVEDAELPPGLAEFLPSADELPPGQRLQGYLFPDTYILPADSHVGELVQLMIETMDLRFTPAMRAAAAEQGLNTHEAITIASIVEREAVVASERPLIAGVFYNRIRANDLIGADPTTQFMVALDPESVAEHGYWKQGLTQEELDRPSPYNTRAVPGIPPGPITNPGLASLEAVAYPIETQYYYFVANAVEGDGSHVFAVTEAEHLANVALYGSAE